MKITSKLAFEYIKKNKKRSIATLVRNSTWNNTINNITYINNKL